MKISFCTGWDIDKDGIADYSRHLTEELKKYDVDIQIIKLGHNINQADYYKQLAKQANEADVCHIQYNYVYFNGDLPYRNRFLYFVSRLRLPIIMTVHEVRIGYERSDTGINNKAKRFVFNKGLFFWNAWSVSYHKRMYNSVGAVHVHTKSQARLITPLVKNPDKVAVIPHAIPIITDDKKSFPSLQAKKNLGLEGKRVITVFGFINKRKGLELVLNILAQLPDDVVLLVAGGPMTNNTADTQYYDSIKKLISGLKLTQRVKITGYLKEEDIPMVMSSSDICLAAFLTTAASGALSLYIGYNKPIIASDIPVHREIFERLPCLEMFSYERPLELRDKIIGLLDSASRKEELIGLTRQYCQTHNYYAIAGILAEKYKQLKRL